MCVCYTYDMDRRVRISSMEGVGESVCYTYDMDRRARIGSMEGVGECVCVIPMIWTGGRG